jgi:hypothetical protein
VSHYAHERSNHDGRQTLTEIGAEQNSTVVFPMPIDIMKPFLEILDRNAKPLCANGATRIPGIEDAATPH